MTELLKKKIILIVLLMLFAAQSLAQENSSEVSEVWGRIIKVDEKHSFQGHRYFIYYSENNNQYAYPIEIKNARQEKMVSAHVNKLAKISGSVNVVKFDNDGAIMTVVYFIPKKIAPLQLSQLGGNTLDVRQTKNAQRPSPQHEREGGIRISDQAANYAIFAAGSLLIGSILKDYIKKK